MIYLSTAVGFPPGGSSTVHIYTQTVHRTTQNKQYIEQHKNIGSLVRAVPHLCWYYIFYSYIYTSVLHSLAVAAFMSVSSS
jgi:hypothetical protein